MALARLILHPNNYTPKLLEPKLPKAPVRDRRLHEESADEQLAQYIIRKRLQETDLEDALHKKDIDGTAWDECGDEMLHFTSILNLPCPAWMK